MKDSKKMIDTKDKEGTKCILHESLKKISTTGQNNETCNSRKYLR